MIQTYEKFRMPDENKLNDFFVEVNWNPKDEKTNESKLLKITFPDGRTAMIKREYLNQMLFAIGNPDDQKKLIPQKLETVHWRKTILGVKATKDIKKGEMVNFPIEISFPCSTVKQIIGEHNFKKEVAKQQAKDMWKNPTMPK